MTPANDNARTLADQLTALLAWRNRPDEEPPEPLQSNWTTEPTQTVEPEVRTNLHTEQYLKVTPSIEEIYREMAHAPVRNDAGQIVAIGRLHFSDGTQMEKASMRGPEGDVIQYDRRMPTGAMLGTSERLTDSAGGSQSPDKVTIGKSKLAERLGVTHVQYIPGKRKRRGKSYTAEESRTMLAEAIANTPVLPEVTKFPPGLANGTAQASDCFIGMKVAATGKSGAIGWVDMYTAGREREEWLEAADGLSKADRAVLDAAMSAKSMAEIAPGGSVRGARKRGKRLLVAANDNFAVSLRKTAS